MKLCRLNALHIMKKINFFFTVLLFSGFTHAQKMEDLALTPPMGWNSWNTFQTKISEQLVMETADLFVSTGMKDAGYNYIVLDDGWMAMLRDSVTGNLVGDPQKFPHGIKFLSDYVHSKGIKFGLYNCAGTKTCAGYPGTRGYEYQDARYYASMGVDYLKFDWCNADGINAKEAYATMSKALRQTGRPIVFSLCEWGNNKPWLWAKNVGQLWRTTGDITNQFDGYQDHGTWKQNGVMVIVDQQDSLRKYAGPGHWNDPDMLEVGNGMTNSEDRSHFALWCMMAAPLITGNDLRKMNDNTKMVILNKEAISIDQDAMGIQCFKSTTIDSVEIWIKPLQNNEVAYCFLNRTNSPKSINYNWIDHGFTDALSNMHVDFKQTVYNVYDVWQMKNKGNTSKVLSATIASHDVLFLKLKRE